MTIDIQVDQSPSSHPFVPDKAFLASFKTQYSESLTKASERFAMAMVFRRGKRAARGDVSYARALVQNALSDTILGDVSFVRPASRRVRS